MTAQSPDKTTLTRAASATLMRRMKDQAMNQIPATPGANKLLDQLLAESHLKNDAALARELGVAPPVVSKLRHGRLAVGPTMILFIHEKFGMPVKSIREVLA